MPCLKMGEQLNKLDEKTIEREITRTSPGNYGIGYIQDNTFHVCRVGRSDDDVKGRLKQYVGVEPDRYTHFQLKYASSIKEAFEKECWNFHDCNPPDNDRHPDRPDNTNLQCPVCKGTHR